MHAVIIAIRDIGGDQFTAPEVMERTGLAPSSVHTLISRLQQARFVERIDGSAAERTVRYRRIEVEALEALAGVGGTR